MELSHKHQVFLTVSIVAVMFVIILILLVPALKGNNIANEFKKYGYDINSVLDDLEKSSTQIKVLEVKTQTCEESNKEYISQIKDLTNKTYSSIENNKKLQTNFEILQTECETNLTNIQKESKDEIEKTKKECNDMVEIYKNNVTKLKNQIIDINEKNNIMIHNAALNICCKYKVDYPDTNSYVINNNKIVCGVDKEIEIEC